MLSYILGIGHYPNKFFPVLSSTLGRKLNPESLKWSNRPVEIKGVSYDWNKHIVHIKKHNLIVKTQNQLPVEPASIRQ